MTTPMREFEEWIDNIDASVFSGDMLYDDEQRELLKHHIER